MRGPFFEALVELAERDPRIVLLTADLGYMVVDRFAQRFPGRFFNVGVAEQNMVGLATGLAESGFIPFVYSIVPFAVLRPYEFIRNGPVMHRLPVRIIGVGGGFDYAHDGVSHYGLEDLGVMRMQPGLAVIAPADAAQAASALRATWDLPGPLYCRLGKDERRRVPGLDGRFEVGRAQQVRDGADLLVVATGSIASEAAAAAELLSANGIEATVIVAACLSPAPEADLAAAVARHRLTVTVEAHYIGGGLGTLVAELIAELGLDSRLVRCGIGSLTPGTSGSQEYMNALHGLNRDALAETARRALGERKLSHGARG